MSEGTRRHEAGKRRREREEEKEIFERDISNLKLVRGRWRESNERQTGACMHKHERPDAGSQLRVR